MNPVRETRTVAAEDLVMEVCDKYEGHLEKVIHYLYDHTAIGRTPTKKIFKDVVAEAFRSRGWVVIEHYLGDTPDHDIKYETIKNLVNSKGDGAIRINEVECEEMISSMEQAPAIMVQGKTAKDKRTEKQLNFPAEESTHFSDAFDQIVWGLLELNIREKINSKGVLVKSRIG